MNLIYPTKIENIYKIFKKNYNFNIKECTIKLININIFDEFKETISIKDPLFDFHCFKKYIDKCDRCYDISYKDVNIYVIMIGDMNKNIQEHLCNSIYRVYLTAKLYEIKKSFNYYLILNPLKRKLPNINHSINAENINGGFTYINNDNIYILRKEDYEKVMIHELIHHHKLIHNERWKNSNLDKLKNFCNIKKDCVLIPNEAIVETFACIINTIFYSIEYNVSFKLLLKKDREYNLLLSYKILDKQAYNEWYEKTHSYCYIVYKTIFYIYFNNFLKIYKYNNDTEITNFILEYFPKLKEKIRKKKYSKVNKSLKQTIYKSI